VWYLHLLDDYILLTIYWYNETGRAGTFSPIEEEYGIAIASEPFIP
jgi:hypothetical protein